MIYQLLKKTLLFSFLLGGVFPFIAQAKTFSMSVDWKYNESTNVMSFTIKSMNLRYDDTKISCSSLSPCFIAMTYSAHLGYPWKQRVNVSGTSLKAEDIVFRFSKDLPVSGSMPVVRSPNECYMVGIIWGYADEGYYLGSTCDGSINPPEPPKPPVSCYMNGDVYLRHGSLADSEVTGNRAESTAYVYCTGAAKVKVRAIPSVGSDSYTVNLRPDGSLTSVLSVNNVVGNGGVTLDVPGVGGKAVTFSSILIAAGTPAPGSFSGSAVAVVDIL
ncbi:MrpH family fimbial adhesin [Serratia sp. IR-2025]